MDYQVLPVSQDTLSYLALERLDLGLRKNTRKRRAIRRHPHSIATLPTMSDFFIDGRDLAGSSYESDSDRTPIARPRGQPGNQSSKGKKRETEHGTGHSRRKVDVTALFSQGADADILSIFNAEVTIGNEPMSVFDAAEPELGAYIDEQPSYELAVQLHNILRRSNLSLKKKQEFFSILGWKFQCIVCRLSKNSEHFENSTFYLWGDTKPFRPQLRSGPCQWCKERQKKGKISDAIVRIEVEMPPECY